MSRTETMPSRPERSAGGTTGAMRRCIVTRESLPTSRMVRFVVAPDDAVVPDIRGKLPGRGLWLTARRDIVDRASAANLFARAARRRVVVGDDLSDRVESLLRERCLELIGMARRAGQAVAGYEKVRGYLQSGRARAIVVACDAAPGSRAKIMGSASGVMIVDGLSAAELGRVFGREAVVHVGIGSRELAARLVEQADRLAGFMVPAKSGKLD